MGQIEDKFTEKGYQIKVPEKLTILCPAVRVGNTVRTSGHVSVNTRGKVGTDVTVEEAYDGARDAILDCLGSVKWLIGDLDKIKRIVHVLGMVNAGEDFSNTPGVINGATELLIDVWGNEAGWHTRSAVGLYQLPGNSSVELELTVEVTD